MKSIFQGHFRVQMLWPLGTLNHVGPNPSMGRAGIYTSSLLCSLSLMYGHRFWCSKGGGDTIWERLLCADIASVSTDKAQRHDDDEATRGHHESDPRRGHYDEDASSMVHAGACALRYEGLERGFTRRLQRICVTIRIGGP